MRWKVSFSSFSLISMHCIALILVGFTLLFSLRVSVTQAEVPPITPSGLNTQVNLSATPLAGHVQYDITGGTRPGGGTNLFHSFGDFNVPTSNIANFLNDSHLPTSNILGRVTDGNISNIFGIIQTTGFGNANLFLMNPAGFLFGPNATINVGGMVAFTSANYLRLANGAQFSAIPNAADDALLTALPVATFGFLGSNPGAITVQGSQFMVTEGTGISLVGGNITIQSGTPEGGTAQPARLSAPNGNILLASAASPGEFDAATLQAMPNVDGALFTSFGSVALAHSSNIDISGANTVSIRGGQFVLSVNDAVLNTAQIDGLAETISLSPNSSMISLNAAVDPGADVQIIATNLQMDGASIQTLTTGDGPGGNISIHGQEVSLTNGAQIVSATEGLGQGGNVSVAADSLITIAGLDSEGTLPGVLADGVVRSGIFSTSSSLGIGGDITIHAPTIALDQLGIIASTTISDGQGGNITVEETTLSITGGGEIRSETGMIDPDSGDFVGGTGQGGNISITTEESVLVSGLLGFFRSGITSGTLAAGTGGNITLSSPHVLIENAGLLRSFGVGDGANGNISITATGSLIVRGFQDISIPGLPVDFRIASAISSEAGATGTGGSVNILTGTMAVENQAFVQTLTSSQANAGDLTVNSGALNISGGGFIDSTGAGEGATGRVSVTATGTLSIQGSPGLDDFNQSRISNTQDGEAANGGLSVHAKDIVMTEGGRIRNDSVGQSSSTTLIGDNSITIASGSRIASRDDVGVVGPIELSAPSITLDQGSITTRTATTATGGAITLNGQNITLTNGSELASATEQSSGQGGPITVIASDSITVSGGSSIQSISFVSGPAGDISLNATNSIVLSGPGTTVSTQTLDTGAGGAITVQAQHISMTDGAVVTAKSTGSGAAGSVTIEGTRSPANSVLIDGAGSSIVTNTEGTGAGGNIFVNANSVTLQNGGKLSAETSGTADTATGGTITVNATQIELNLGRITAGTDGSGDAGTIHINATDRIALTNGAIIDSSASGGPDMTAQGNGGTITLHAPHITISEDAKVGSSTLGPGNAGDVVLETQSLIMSGVGARFGRIIADTQGTGQGGNITVQGLEGPQSAAEVVELTHGSLLFAKTTAGQTDTQGNAGSIHVQAATLVLDGASQLSTTSDTSTGGAGTIIVDATDSVHLSGGSSITSTSTDAFGQAGDITITSPTIWLKGASFISTSTDLVGNAGNITLHTQALSLTEGSQLTSNSGPQRFPEFLSGSAGSVRIQNQGSPAQSVLIDGPDSGIFTDTQGTGVGGNIFVNANTVTLQNGGVLSAATSGTDTLAIGGTITVEANQVHLNNGGLITASTTGAGAGGSITIGADSTFTSNASTVSSTATQAQGGDIKITAGQSATLNNGSSISASSTGVGDAGNIAINAGQTFLATNSSVTTQANLASGGTIKITTTPSGTVELTNSTISASVLNGTGGGGSVDIDPLYVLLQNSQILAQAVQGPGGNITINITNGGLFLPDANSTISASSQFGVNGTVTIQSPNAPTSGQIQPLGKSPLLATSLLNQRCASLAGGEFSSFTVAGRDSLPTEPGGWLTSPLATLNAGMGLGVKAEGGRLEGMTLEASPADETTVLSLRKIAPAGFLTQAFATDSSTGCS